MQVKLNRLEVLLVGDGGTLEEHLYLKAQQDPSRDNDLTHNSFGICGV
jgi:hypothetical protein